MEKRIRRVRLPWPVFKAQFVRRRLDGENLSLAAFAREVGCDVRSVERHASAEGWLAAVAERAQERLDAAHDAQIVNLMYSHMKRSFRVR